jgi:hypothetical protein
MPVRKDIDLGLEIYLELLLQDSPEAIAILGTLSLGLEE